MLVTAPGLDGNGTSCRPANPPPGSFGFLPSGVEKDLPTNQSWVIMSPVNSTYNDTAWSNCCKDHKFSLVQSCYPWCLLPDDLLSKQGKSESGVISAFANCIGNPGGGYQVKLNAGETTQVSRMHWAVVGLAMLSALLV